MGLLDGLLGQVLAGMAQGEQQRGPAAGGLDDLLAQLGGKRGASGSGGLEDLLAQLGGQRGASGGGGLGDLLNRMGGMQGAPGGGMPGPDRGAGGGGMGGLGGAALGGLVMLALQMLRQRGGLGNVLGQLQQQGHGREADSWVSGGENLPISPDVLAQIFGREEIGRAAQQMGLSPDEAAGGLASIFPEVVNEITPQGRVESGSDDLVARTLEILERNRRA